MVWPRIAFALGELSEGLIRIPLMKLGRFRKANQVIPLTRQLMSEVVTNFRKRKARGVDNTAGDVVVDYEHASEDPAVAMGGIVPAAGWLREVEDAPDANGILWGLIELTGKARAAVAAKELRYTSPFIQEMKDKVTGEPQGATLTSVALTNKPFQEWLPAIALSDGWQEEGIDRPALANQKASKVSDTVFNPASSWDAFSVELNRRIKWMLKEDSSKDYRTALTAVMLDDRSFARNYLAAKIRNLGSPGVEMPHADQRAGVDAEMLPLVREKIAASDGGMDYGAALRLVLTERPDLARRRMDTM